MKSTFELYRAEPTEFADLPYKEAIRKKIECAKQAMVYYRDKAFEALHEGNHRACANWTDKYMKSENALYFNRELLSEVESYEQETGTEPRQADESREEDEREGERETRNLGKMVKTWFDDQYKNGSEFIQYLKSKGE